MITTVRHNVGDDFTREGILYLLKEAWPGVPFAVQNIHKHMPVTVRGGFEWIRSGRLSRLLDRLPPLSEDKMLAADMVVQSGAPAYWCHPQYPGGHCGLNEWFQPLLIKRHASRTRMVPLVKD